MRKQPSIVVLGGGSGISVLLRGLKHLPVDITTIVTVADSGGSSGVLRKEFSCLPPGDFRNVIAALSDVEPLMEEVFQYRFQKDTFLGGHTLGNLIIMAMTELTGNLQESIDSLRKLFNIKAQILPASLDNVTLAAKKIDGSIVEGENEIPRTNQKIQEVFYTTQVSPIPKTLEIIKKADLIILGMGSLYTSLIPHLLVEGISESIVKSKAKKIYICNAMEQPGETEQYTVSDHVKAIYQHSQEGLIDTILVDSHSIPKREMKRYEEAGVSRVEIDFSKLQELGLEVIDRNMIEVDKKGMIRHHPYRLAAVIYSLIDHWERFYD